MAVLGGFIIIWIVLAIVWLSLVPKFEKIGSKIVNYFKRTKVEK